MIEFYCSSILPLCGGDTDKTKNFKNYLVQQIQQRKAKLFIGHETWEQWPWVIPELLSLIEWLTKNNIKSILIWDSSVKNDVRYEALIKAGAELFFVNYFLYRVYKEVVVQKVCETNKQWDPAQKNFLFLTGKPYKVNRLDLLLRFHDLRLLEKCTWSLLLDADNLPDPPDWYTLPISEEKLKVFAKEHVRNPDNIVPRYKQKNSLLHYGGIPFDKNLYGRCRFRVISESHFKNSSQKFNPWITEKTWLTIVNRCPFIMAGDAGTLTRLKEMGFRTFEKYLPIADYDQIQDPSQRLDAIVTNTAWWIDHMDCIESIADDVEHNYNQFVRLGEKTHQDLISLISELDIELTPEILLPTHDNFDFRMSNSGSIR